MTVPVGTPAEKTHLETPKPRVSKRLRYEILRRDNHACRYCGAMAPDAKLTIDHVTPVALGGTNEPGNLVTACADCNSGKGATPPGAPLVDDVAQDAIRWARAIARATEIQFQQREEMASLLFQFDKWWLDWHYGYDERPIPRPGDWGRSIEVFSKSGLTMEELDYALNRAMRSKVAPDQKWRYFCGILWRILEERQEIAKALAAQEDQRGA